MTVIELKTLLERLCWEDIDRCDWKIKRLCEEPNTTERFVNISKLRIFKRKKQIIIH